MGDLIKFVCFPAPDESEESFGASMKPFSATCEQSQEEAMPQLQLSGVGNLIPTGGFPIEWVTVLAMPMATALGAWLKERYGRKVWVKIGDIEAEATSVEEVNLLLAKAQEIKRDNEPRRIHE